MADIICDICKCRGGDPLSGLHLSSSDCIMALRDVHDVLKRIILEGGAREKCQLCETGCPKVEAFDVRGINLHQVGWDPSTACLIPCTQEDRDKLEEFEKNLSQERPPGL